MSSHADPSIQQRNNPGAMYNCHTTKTLMLRPTIKHFGKIGGRSNGAFWTTALINPGLRTNPSMCVARRSPFNGITPGSIKK